MLIATHERSSDDVGSRDFDEFLSLFYYIGDLIELTGSYLLFHPIIYYHELSLVRSNSLAISYQQSSISNQQSQSWLLWKKSCLLPFWDNVQHDLADCVRPTCIVSGPCHTGNSYYSFSCLE